MRQEYRGENLDFDNSSTLIDDEFKNGFFDEKLDIKIYDYMIIHRFGYSIIHEKISNLNLDHDLTSGLISAIISVSKELFDEGKGIKILDFGDKKIIIETGENIILGVITEFITNDLKKYLKKLINYIEEKFGDLIGTWEGNITEMQPVTAIIHNALIPFLIESIKSDTFSFDDIKNEEELLFSISDLNLITLEDILQIKNKIKDVNLNEAKIYSLLRLLSQDALTFHEIRDLLNIEKILLKKLLNFLRLKQILRIFRRLDNKKFEGISTSVRVALQDNYFVNLGNIANIGHLNILDTSITFNEIKEDNVAVIFPILIAVVKTENKIIPYVMKNIEKFRDTLAKDILREASYKLNSKELGLLKTIKKIDSFW